MLDLTIYARDFRNSQDHPFESLFECILGQLNIPEDEWNDIDAITIKDILKDDIEIEKI